MICPSVRVGWGALPFLFFLEESMGWKPVRFAQAGLCVVDELVRSGVVLTHDSFRVISYEHFEK